jgi:hypothetical protein
MVGARPLSKSDEYLIDDSRLEPIKHFLYEEGPHTAREVAAHFNQKVSWISERLGELKDLGEVIDYKRSVPIEKNGLTMKSRDTRTFWRVVEPEEICYQDM